MLAYDHASREMADFGIWAGWRFDSALGICLETRIWCSRWRLDYVEQDWWELMH